MQVPRSALTFGSPQIDVVTIAFIGIVERVNYSNLLNTERGSCVSPSVVSVFFPLNDLNATRQGSTLLRAVCTGTHTESKRGKTAGRDSHRSISLPETHAPTNRLLYVRYICMRMDARC